MAAIYTCEQIRPVQFTNFMGYCNKEVDALFAQAGETMDESKRKAIFLDIQKRIMADAPAVWTVGNVDWIAYRDTVQGLPAGPWNGRDPLDGVWLSAQ
jgi:peptide/nickel transport system substrate-binding protein